MTALEHLQLRELPPMEELCRCSGSTRLHLRYEFSEFPLFCAECTGQILPAALELSPQLAREIVRWRTVYSALYDLWLDSGDYETFARAALLDKSGDVNRCGLAVAAELSKQRFTYYWWFRDDPPGGAGGELSTLSGATRRTFQTSLQVLRGLSHFSLADLDSSTTSTFLPLADDTF